MPNENPAHRSRQRVKRGFVFFQVVAQLLNAIDLLDR